MSYARMGNDSNVYVIGTQIDGVDVLECVWCTLQEEPYFSESIKKFIEHLMEHLKKGEKVPKYVFDRLFTELMKSGDKYTI